MPLSDFVNRIVRKNSNNESDLALTISSKDGLVDQITYFNKTVASKDMSGYYLLLNGEFAYNKSYSVGFDFGSIKRLDRYPMGALSTLYICFALKKYDSDFIKTYFDSLKWYREIYMIAAEGARNHGLLNIPTEEFFATKHMLPDNINEQKKIAAFFSLIDMRIEKQRQLVDALKSYKRGLVTRLFPQNESVLPAVRLSTYNAPWQSVRIGEVGVVYMCKRIFKEQTSATGEIPFFKIGTFGGFADAYIPRNLFEEYKIKYPYPQKGDVLISASGSIGRTVVFSGMDEYFQDSNIIWIRFNGQIINPFWKHLCEQLSWKGVEGSTIKRLYNDNVLNTRISFPSIGEQQSIAAFLNTVDQSISQAEKIASALVALKGAFLQHLFI